jgi:hypothetical protein
VLNDISAEDQFKFAKSRLGADIDSKGADDHFGLSPDDDKETAKSLPRLGDPSRNNLTPRRKKLPPLPPEDEAALIAAVQARDTTAGHKLFLHHESTVRTLAYKRWWAVNSNRHNDERALSLDDFVAVALEAFWESVRRWKPGYRLNTAYRLPVRGALADIGHEWRNALGVQIDTRVQSLKTEPLFLP